MGGRKRREGKKYDVFISYSQADRKIADELCAHLEARGMVCWIAPRNIPSGERWAKAIMDAIAEADHFVLVLSRHSNQSGQVANEVAAAFNAGCSLFQFLIDGTPMNQELNYYLGRMQWLDANPPTPERYEELYQQLISGATRQAQDRIRSKDVFISYALPNKAQADRLCAYLESHGEKCWYAPRDIEGDELWMTGVETALADSRYYVLLLSDDFRDYARVIREFMAAFESGCTLIPVQLGESQLSDKLSYHLNSSKYLSNEAQTYLKRTLWFDARDRKEEVWFRELYDMTADDNDVYIAFERRDVAAAEKIFLYLEDKGLRCWYSPRELNASDNSGLAMTRAISKTRYYVLVMSAYVNTSQRLEKEIREAARNDNCQILTMRVTDTPYRKELKPHLKDAVEIGDYRKSVEERLPELYGLISGLDPRSERKKGAKRQESDHAWEKFRGSSSRKIDVYISYSHSDGRIADDLCSYLEERGARCWYAPRDIAPGEEWADAILDAIRNSVCFVPIISKASSNSRQVTNEIVFAFDAKCHIVPFEIDAIAEDDNQFSMRRYYLNGKHAIRGMVSMEDGYQELYEYLLQTLSSMYPEACADSVSEGTAAAAKAGQSTADVVKANPRKVDVVISCVPEDRDTAQSLREYLTYSGVTCRLLTHQETLNRTAISWIHRIIGGITKAKDETSGERARKGGEVNDRDGAITSFSGEECYIFLHSVHVTADSELCAEVEDAFHSNLRIIPFMIDQSPLTEEIAWYLDASTCIMTWGIPRDSFKKIYEQIPER